MEFSTSLERGRAFAGSTCLHHRVFHGRVTSRWRQWCRTVDAEKRDSGDWGCLPPVVRYTPAGGAETPWRIDQPRCLPRVGVPLAPRVTRVAALLHRTAARARRLERGHDDCAQSPR